MVNAVTFALACFFLQSPRGNTPSAKSPVPSPSSAGGFKNKLASAMLLAAKKEKEAESKEAAAASIVQPENLRTSRPISRQGDARSAPLAYFSLFSLVTGTGL